MAGTTTFLLMSMMYIKQISKPRFLFFQLSEEQNRQQ